MRSMCCSDPRLLWFCCAFIQGFALMVQWSRGLGEHDFKYSGVVPSPTQIALAPFDQSLEYAVGLGQLLLRVLAPAAVPFRQ